MGPASFFCNTKPLASSLMPNPRFRESSVRIYQFVHLGFPAQDDFNIGIRNAVGSTRLSEGSLGFSMRVHIKCRPEALSNFSSKYLDSKRRGSAGTLYINFTIPPYLRPSANKPIPITSPNDTQSLPSPKPQHQSQLPRSHSQTSPTKSSKSANISPGLSSAGKCPPSSCPLNQHNLPVLPTQLRGIGANSLGKYE